MKKRGVTGHYGGRGLPGSGRWWLALMTLATGADLSLPVRGQSAPVVDSMFQTSPGLPFSGQDEMRYNLKWGRLTGRVTGTLQAEYNDNINLSDRFAEGDFSLGPQVDVGFLWPMSDLNVMQFDLGVGYRWYVDHPGLTTFYVSPGSQWNYRMRIGDVRVEVHDEAQVLLDPTSRPEISGGEQIIDFRRLNNTAGVMATWTVNSETSLRTGYDFSIDRTLSGEFDQLDRDTHTAHVGGNRALGSRWNVGFLGTYSVFGYLRRIQNDGQGYSLGPTLAFRPTRFIFIDIGVAYSALEFDQTGVLGDASSFSGLTYDVGVRHNFNSRASHFVKVRRRAEVGYGSNYTDLMAVQYGLTGRITSAVRVNAHVAYETFELSGLNGETADRYLVQLDTRYQLTRQWAVSLGYGFSWKVSESVDRDYRQNRVTLQLTREF